MPPPQLSWVETLTEDSLCICINLELYTLEALFRVCYLFTDRCYLFLTEESPSVVKVHFARKTPACDLPAIAGAFSNELIDQKVRLDIANETRTIRELIVAQAFTEADLGSSSCSEADYHEDPKGISK
jgi:His-Xaa-Ser system protein HxsD